MGEGKRKRISTAHLITGLYGLNHAPSIQMLNYILRSQEVLDITIDHITIDHGSSLHSVLDISI